MNIMANVITSGLQKAQSAAQTAAGGDAKRVDLARDTVEVTKDDFHTTDAGGRVSNLDNWLRVSTDQREGPNLLEDHIGRERVRDLSSIGHSNTLLTSGRSIDLITNAFLSGLSMRAEVVHSEPLGYLRALRMSPRLVF